MNDLGIFFEEISIWTTYPLSEGNEVYDFITFWTKQNKIQVDWKFQRSKSMIYNEKLKDTVMFYSKDINYLIKLNKFKSKCNDKFIVYNHIYNELAQLIH